MRKNLLLALTSLMLVACQHNVVYTDFCTLPNNGWEADSTVCFQPTIEDTAADYQFQLILRHTDAYQYQNLWMFLEVKNDSAILSQDTIECYLADDRGNWLGGGVSVHELPLMFDAAYHFPHSGQYQITIQQGMRSENLEGIKEIGVKIITNGKK